MKRRPKDAEGDLTEPGPRLMSGLALASGEFDVPLERGARLGGLNYLMLSGVSSAGASVASGPVPWTSAESGARGLSLSRGISAEGLKFLESLPSLDLPRVSLVSSLSVSEEEQVALFIAYCFNVHPLSVQNLDHLLELMLERHGRPHDETDVATCRMFFASNHAFLLSRLKSETSLSRMDARTLFLSFLREEVAPRGSMVGGRGPSVGEVCVSAPGGPPPGGGGGSGVSSCTSGSRSEAAVSSLPPLPLPPSMSGDSRGHGGHPEEESGGARSNAPSNLPSSSRHWSSESLMHAMTMMDQGCSCREAARRTMIPHSTLHDRYKNPKKYSHPGKPPILSPMEESLIGQFLLDLHKDNYCITRHDLGTLVMGIVAGRNHPFKTDGPHRHWFASFLRRNPELRDAVKSSKGEGAKDISGEILSGFVEQMRLQIAQSPAALEGDEDRAEPPEPRG